MEKGTDSLKVYVLYEEYYGDPGPPSYNISSVHMTRAGAMKAKDFLKTFPTNKFCSYSIFEYEVED